MRFMCALGACSLRGGLRVSVSFCDCDEISGFHDAAFYALGEGVRGRGRGGGGGDLKAVAACGRQQQQHDIAHLLHVNFALAHANSFDNHVAVARRLTQLHHLVRVLSKTLSKAESEQQHTKEKMRFS